MTVTIRADGFWIPSPFGGPDVRFKLRDMDPVESARFEREATTYRTITKNGKEEIVRDVDHELLAWLRLDYMLIDWEGIVDEQGQKLACTSDIKRALYVQHPIGMQKLLMTYAKIKIQEDKGHEELKKNSNGSSKSGSTTRRSTAGPASGSGKRTARSRTARTDADAT